MADGQHDSARQVIVRNASLPLPGSAGLRSVDILIQHGVIQEISAPCLPVSERALTIDASGQIVIPSLVNSHTHSHFALGRGYADLWTLELHQNSGGGISYGALLEDLRIGAMLGAADMIRNGCTATYDMVLQSPVHSPEGMAAVAQGYEDAGIRAVVAAAVADRSFWDSISGLYDSLPQDAAAFVRSLQATSSTQHLAALEDIISNWHFDTKHIKFALAPSVPLLCSDDFLQRIALLATKHGVMVQTHLAESKVQAVVAQQRWGKSLTRYLADIGFLGAHVSAAHAIWLEQDDIDTLARHKVCIAHNPGSNMRLGNGIAPIVAMQRQGLNIGLGTDACSCSDQQNMMESMRLAAYSSRLTSPDPANWLSAESAFQMATQGSAALLGFPTMGKLQVGYSADMVFIDRNDLAYVPFNNFWNQLVFSETGRSVQRVIANGRTIYENGQFLTFDYPQLLRQAQAAADRLADLGQERRAQLKALEPLVSQFCVGLAHAPHPVNRYIGS